jgi:exopolysaccharide biosynthesis predicted pyruvyltransferase EpsI
MIKKIYTRLNGEIDFFLFRISAFLTLKLNKKKTIYLFGCPIHANLGDQAQTYCIKKWMRESFPDYRIFEFNWKISTKSMLRLLKKKIKSDDLIFGHSGYFFFEPHRELPVFRKIAELFPDQKIVILPQTINLTDPRVLRETSNALNSHPNLTLLCRDEISYAKAEKQFANCRLLLYPDVVTSLIGKLSFSNSREGILFCLRNDIEAHYKKNEIEKLIGRFESFEKIKITDTTVGLSFWQIRKNRESVLKKTFDDFSKFKVVITDRYHGTIFSLIANTPVIVLSSADHKLSSGVRWFPESFGRYVNYAKNLDEAYLIAKEILRNPPDIKLSAMFEENYFSKLKGTLE